MSEFLFGKSRYSLHRIMSQYQVLDRLPAYPKLPKMPIFDQMKQIEKAVPKYVNCDYWI